MDNTVMAGISARTRSTGVCIHLVLGSVVFQWICVTCRFLLLVQIVQSLLVVAVGELKQKVSGMKLGAEMENCGVEEDCDDRAFSLQLYSGDRNVDPPKICVNGKQCVQLCCSLSARVWQAPRELQDHCLQSDICTSVAYLLRNRQSDGSRLLKAV